MPVELARPGIRSDNPLQELADRLARLHRGAWQLVREQHVGVTTLTDYAALGVILHGHAAALLEPAERPGDRDAAKAVIAAIRGAGAAWRHLHLQLDDLRTATPGSAGVRSDLLRVRQLLNEHVPVPGAGSATVPSAVDRHLIATLLGAVGSLDAIGAWNAQTFDNLVVARHLYVDGHRRTGDEILDRDDLLPAKFEGRLVSVTPGRLLAVREAYSSTLTAQRSAWSGRNRTGAWPAVACSSAAHDSPARQS